MALSAVEVLLRMGAIDADQLALGFVIDASGSCAPAQLLLGSPRPARTVTVAVATSSVRSALRMVAFTR
jgi:hypothetical protein